MLRYLIRRLLWAAVLFIAVTFVTYVIFFIIPADPARSLAGQGGDAERRSSGSSSSSASTSRSRSSTRRSSSGSSSTSRSARRSRRARTSTTSSLRAAPVTASLVFGGAIFWMMIAIPIGILSALRPRSLFDRAAMVFVLIGISAHPVWIGLILSYFFGYKLGWYADRRLLRLLQPVDRTAAAPCSGRYHLILPWMTFALLFAALYTRMIRANVMETMNEDYVRTARAKGAPESRVMRSHVLRNAPAARS